MKKQIEIDNRMAEVIDLLIYCYIQERGEKPNTDAFDRLVTVLSNEFPECGILETKRHWDL